MGALSPWQRLWRRIALSGGSYTHPDGYIELEGEEQAGVTRQDDSDTAAAKLEAYNRRRSAGDRIGGVTFGSAVLGVVAYWFASNAGFTPLEAVGLGIGTAFGIWTIATSALRL